MVGCDWASSKHGESSGVAVKNNHRTVSQEWRLSFRMEIKAMKGRRMWKRQSWRKPVFASASHVHLPSAQNACSRILATLQIQKQPRRSSQARIYHLQVLMPSPPTSFSRFPWYPRKSVLKVWHWPSQSMTSSTTGGTSKSKPPLPSLAEILGITGCNLPVPSLYWEYACHDDQIISADRVSLQALRCRLVGCIGKDCRIHT